jgi:hypothetical protein
MALTTCSVATNVIASLGTTPQERGLTTDEFKAKFDKEATDLKDWINNTHLPEVYGKLLEAVLTAQGDVPYASAANTPARLAKGTAGQSLTMNAGATAPEWQTRPLLKIGTFTRDVATASGDQAVTGVGFQPRVVIFLTLNGAGEMSVGFDSGSAAVSLVDYHNVTPNSYVAGTSKSLVLYASASNTYWGNISSMDSDGFTIAWTKGGTITGTASIIYLAIA